MPYKDSGRQRAYQSAYRRQHADQIRQYRKDHADKFAEYNRNARGKRLPFVAIDSEGVSYGDKIKIGNEFAQPQKTVFWGAGNMDRIEWLNGDPFCNASNILDWLCSLPERLGKAIFVWFGSSYDATQIFLDLPYEKAWELQHGKSYENRFTAERGRSGRYVFVGNFALSYIKQKCLRIGELSEQSLPGKLKFKRQITIYDVFGFFQTSFIKAASSIPGAMQGDDFKIIEEGKADRTAFTFDKIAQMKRYTERELIVLARMMESFRDSLENIGVKLSRWQGAGSIAAAMMKANKVSEHFWPVETFNISQDQQWAHSAFYGGRIELLKQGCTTAPLWSYDIKSAYPFHMSDLSSMSGGKYVDVSNPTQSRVEKANTLSMFEVEFECKIDEDAIELNRIYGFPGPEFYPFPYRDCSGRITFPPMVRGIYMQAEVSAAFKWLSYYREQFKLRTGCDLPAKLSIKRGKIFKPRRGCIAALAWVRDFFYVRRDIQHEIERTGIYNLNEKTLKLGINSVYGKEAQSVGNQGKAPATANPWFAAAITAGTRAQLLLAAISIPPGSLVAFQTDGIISTAPLAVEAKDDLGGWEVKQINGRSIFVQPGIYHYTKNSKHRGIKRDLLKKPSEQDLDFEQWLVDNVVKGWREGISIIEYPYRYYVTLGAAVASEDRFQVAGHWIDSTREIRLDNLGFKRGPTIFRDELKKRAVRLIDTFPKPAYYHLRKPDGWELPFSEPHRPQWLDDEFAAQTELERLNEEIAMTET